ncbi:hypothetical protein IFM89_006000 [Coptis chinensis]|uniref:Cation efflux protein transmembrane domain-containing protein n=1 Tax=Coptis chinensis TaxID=261450 RepID=A0A835IC90_9MAGN|nr:hypothetical protein IFM89_006000 [Coptis chinensis]
MMVVILTQVDVAASTNVEVVDGGCCCSNASQNLGEQACAPVKHHQNLALHLVERETQVDEEWTKESRWTLKNQYHRDQTLSIIIKNIYTVMRTPSRFFKLLRESSYSYSSSSSTTHQILTPLSLNNLLFQHPSSKFQHFGGFRFYCCSNKPNAEVVVSGGGRSCLRNLLLLSRNGGREVTLGSYHQYISHNDFYTKVSSKVNKQTDIDDHSQRAVNTALLANFLVFSLKFGVWLMTSSHVILAEVIHSVADFANQALLAYGLSSSRRAPDALHP